MKITDHLREAAKLDLPPRIIDCLHAAADEIEQARTILAGTAIGSLPDDYPLSKLVTEMWNVLQERTMEGLSFIGRMEAVVAAYDKQNPMRTADCHNPGCNCLRCAVDNIRNTALRAQTLPILGAVS